MTRIFTEAEHIPVTVLSSKCPGARPPAERRTATSRSSAPARASRRGSPSPSASFCKIEVEPKRKLAEFRVSADNLIEVGASHRRPLRAGPVRRRDRHQPGQGLPGRHEALELRRSARHARRLGRAPQPRLDRPAPGPRQGVQGQEDGRPHGRRARHHAEPHRRAATDVDRGLLMVRGAVPGSKGGWVLVRDAVKRPLPKEAPKPGAFKAGGAKPRRRRRDEGRRHHARGGERGHGRARRRDLRPRAAPDLLHRMVRYQQLKRMAGTHHAGPLGGQRHRQEDVQAEGHRRRPPRRQVGAAVARRRQGVRAEAAQPCHRPAEEGARAGAAPCALRQGEGRRDRRARQGLLRTARPAR